MATMTEKRFDIFFEQHKRAEFYLLCSALPSVYCTVNRLVKFFFTAYTSFCQIKRRRG